MHARHRARSERQSRAISTWLFSGGTSTCASGAPLSWRSHTVTTTPAGRGTSIVVLVPTRAVSAGCIRIGARRERRRSRRASKARSRASRRSRRADRVLRWAAKRVRVRPRAKLRPRPTRLHRRAERSLPDQDGAERRRRATIAPSAMTRPPRPARASVREVSTVLHPHPPASNLSCAAGSGSSHDSGFAAFVVPP